VALSATDTGGSGVDHSSYSVDGGTTWLTYVTPFTVATTTNVQYRAFDAAGNAEAVKTQRIQIDNGAPTTTIACNGSACSAGWYTTAPVSLTLSATDGTSGSGVAGSSYSLDNGTTWLTYSGAFGLSTTTTVLYRSSDQVGNVETTRSQLVQIDTTKPTTPTFAISSLTNASVVGSTVFARGG